MQAGRSEDTKGIKGAILLWIAAPRERGGSGGKAGLPGHQRTVGPSVEPARAAGVHGTNPWRWITRDGSSVLDIPIDTEYLNDKSLNPCQVSLDADKY